MQVRSAVRGQKQSKAPKNAEHHTLNASMAGRYAPIVMGEPKGTREGHSGASALSARRRPPSVFAVLPPLAVWLREALGVSAI